MEAKDTVMGAEQMSEEIQKKTKKWGIVNPEFIEDIASIIARAQAEITGKIMYQAGIREVVEWIENNPFRGGVSDETTVLRIISINEWQAKLKEWKIKLP